LSKNVFSSRFDILIHFYFTTHYLVLTFVTVFKGIRNDRQLYIHVVHIHIHVYINIGLILVYGV